MKLRINSIEFRGSIVDGPGIRTVLYVQGCEKRCPGCHNPETWDISTGVWRETKDIAEEIVEKSFSRKVTISGGEPLIQYDAVLELVRYLEGFDISLYTGFEFSKVPSNILGYLNYIKVGEFLQEKFCTTVPYIGSRNQQFIELRRNKFEGAKFK